MDLDAIRADLDAEGVHPLTRLQYERLVEAGVLGEGARVELLFGRMVPMSPQGWAHAWVAEQLMVRLIEGLRGRARVRAHSPMAASDDSEPEPDILVCPHSAERSHPTTGHLVVEVSDTSIRKDRVLKAALYASIDVTEYWVVDLQHRCVHVHRGPRPAGYTSIVQLDADGTLEVQAFPDVRIPVASVLPPS